MNEITIGDKIYISSKRAAEITGYAKDYVGQLCREGHVDAKMVGRSWYVYEPSIRAHRFGEDAAATAVEPVEPKASDAQVEAAIAAAPEPVSTWERPVYKPESFTLIPEMPEPAPEESLTDMQTAWKEWFERKQEQLETPEIEAPEIIDARNEAHEHEHEEERVEVRAPEVFYEPVVETEEVSVPLHRLAEEPEAPREVLEEEDAEPIHIRHIAPPAPVERGVVEQRHNVTHAAAPEAHIVKERIVRRRKAKTPSYVPATAILIAISIVTLAVAAIGTGIASNYAHSFLGNNPVINFLVGTSEFKR